MLKSKNLVIIILSLCLLISIAANVYLAVNNSKRLEDKLLFTLAEAAEYVGLSYDDFYDIFDSKIDVEGFLSAGLYTSDSKFEYINGQFFIPKSQVDIWFS